MVLLAVTVCRGQRAASVCLNSLSYLLLPDLSF